MAYVGNRNGPRESVIVARLGAGYFGIAEETLANEVAWYRNEEMRGEVTPVRRDETGRFFILFSAPNGKTQHYYLDTHRYTLKGEVKLWPSEATMVQLDRS